MVYTKNEMESLKTDRSAQKRKVTTLSNRIKRGFTSKLWSNSEVESHVSELKDAYLDFLNLQEEYATAITDDDELKDEYALVNGLDLEEYASSVQTIYDEVVSIHQDHMNIIETERREKEKELLTLKLVKEIKAVSKEAKRKLGNIVPRVECLLGEEVSCPEERAALEFDYEQLEKIAKQIIEVRGKIEDNPDDLEGEEEDISELLDRTEEFIRKINLVLRHRTRDVNGSIGSTSAEISPGGVSVASLMTSLPNGGTAVSNSLSGSVFSTSCSAVFPPAVTANPLGNPPLSGYLPTSPSLAYSTYPGVSAAFSLPPAIPSSGYPVSAALGNQVPTYTSYSAHAPGSLPPVTSQLGVGGLPLFSGNTAAQSPALGGIQGSSPFFGSPASQHAAPVSIPSALLPARVGAPSAIPEVKVKRLDLPKFNGSRQAWPEFKVLWPKLAVPTFKSDQETLAHQLKLCCTGTAGDMIESISTIGQQPFNTMWERLCQFYDDAAATVRATIKRLKKLKAVGEEDYKGLTYFINEVEAAYSMLTTLNQVSCLTLMQVDELAELLPPLVRKEWNKVYHRLPPDQRNHPFPSMMAFLIEERNVISRLVENQEVTKTHLRKRESYHTGGNRKSMEEKGRDDRNEKKGGSGKSPCAVHTQGSVKHKTADCSAFQQLNHKDKLDTLRSVGACFRCFVYHRRSNCREKTPCSKCGDTRHHMLLCFRENSPALPVVVTSSSSAHSKAMSLYAIFSVPVDKIKQRAIVFTDDGSDSSYITNRAAKMLGARKLNKYLLEVTTTGGKETEYESQEYALDLTTRTGRKVTVTMFGLEKITGKLSRLDLSVISKLFPNMDVSTLQRTRTEVDVLLGTDCFGLHPKHEIQSAGENLSVMEGALGLCLQGSHPDLKEGMCMDTNFVKTLKAVTPISVKRECNHSISVLHPIISVPIVPTTNPCSAESHFTMAEESRLKGFIGGEELATQVVPRCGSCKCSKCPLPGHTYSFKEEAELKLIRDSLRYDESAKAWIARYPWKKDPHSLPDNRNAVLASLYRLKKRLKNDEQFAKTYQEQMVDMVVRGVAKEVSPQELEAYRGPFFYINHLGVPNPRSKSTPFRIVFDSSRSYRGASLNDHLCKGPDAYLNSQLGILLRWRENAVAVVGDIRKMYNSIILEEEEQHCHRYLWSDLDDPIPKTFIITRVNMGDRPAGAISTEALYMTADKFSDDHPAAAVMLKVGSYVDDIMESVETLEEAEDLTKGADTILNKGGFKIKFWLYSGNVLEDEATEVLGVKWYPCEDQIAAQSSLNFSPKKRGVHTLPDLKPEEIPKMIPEKLTKRLVLAQVMKIYDPEGTWSPFTLLGKVLLRRTWEEDLGWDETIPPDLHERWIQFFVSSKELNNLRYPRVLKPAEAVGDPMLVIFSDASDAAYGFAAYVRWQLRNGTFWSRLIIAKCRVAPLTKRSTPQLELNAAVLAKRGREVIVKEMRYRFTKFIHIVDSETVLCMLQKTSTRFNIYEGVRIGEIQASTQGDVSSWAWIAGDKNISDWITRGKNPEEIGAFSDWFSGPSYMATPLEEWGLKFGQPNEEQLLPGEKKVVNTNFAECRKGILEYERFSKYSTLLRVVSRIKSIVKGRSLLAMSANVTPTLLEEGEMIIIKDVQKSIRRECEKQDAKGRVGGTFYRLKPVKQEGVWVVGTRLVLNPLVPENEPQKLLPTKHPVTVLLMKQAHQLANHGGRDSTLARFRQRYWTPHGSKVALSTVQSCQLCKLRIPKLLSQKMGMLPPERSRPAPAFTYTMLDYFGPYKVRGEVQKRISGKAWGVIFTDMVSRAVFIEAVYDYSAASFLLALSKFASVRGYPSIIYSDNDPKLTCASNQLDEQWRSMWRQEGQKIIDVSTQSGLEWRFSSPDAPWMNGAVESLIRSVKKAISFSMQDQRLSPSEFSCLLYEVANTLNERTIGTLTSQDSELSIITPNSLLMGRSLAKNPLGWQPESGSRLLQRYHLVQDIAATFWKQWIKTCAPALMTDTKWHTTGHRELQPGDVVLVLDPDSIRSEYRLAVVKELFRGHDNVVRKVRVFYKHYKVGESPVKYSGSTEQCCVRPVQRLALVVPAE